MNEAIFRLKDSLEEFGALNKMITVERADLEVAVKELFFKGEEWSNQAAIGYVISAAQAMGLQEEVVQGLVSNMQGVFDCKTIEEAADVYRTSSY